MIYSCKRVSLCSKPTTRHFLDSQPFLALPQVSAACALQEEGHAGCKRNPLPYSDLWVLYGSCGAYACIESHIITLLVHRWARVELTRFRGGASLEAEGVVVDKSRRPWLSFNVQVVNMTVSKLCWCDRVDGVMCLCLCF